MQCQFLMKLQNQTSNFFCKDLLHQFIILFWEDLWFLVPKSQKILMTKIASIWLKDIDHKMNFLFQKIIVFDFYFSKYVEEMTKVWHNRKFCQKRSLVFVTIFLRADLYVYDPKSSIVKLFLYIFWIKGKKWKKAAKSEK